MTKLKPCPFCGTEDVVKVGAMVVCPHCKANGPTLIHWNTRRISFRQALSELEGRNVDLIKGKNRLHGELCCHHKDSDCWVIESSLFQYFFDVDEIVEMESNLIHLED